MARVRSRHGTRLRRLGKAVLGFLTVHILRAIRLIDVGTMANFSGGLIRRIVPWLPEHRIGPP